MILTRDRMIEEYRITISKLEKENGFLQIVVKELRDELLNFQKSFKKEEELLRVNDPNDQLFIDNLSSIKR